MVRSLSLVNMSVSFKFMKTKSLGWKIHTLISVNVILKEWNKITMITITEDVSWMFRHTTKTVRIFKVKILMRKAERIRNAV